MIVLIDFGSQTSHLIARRIKDLGIEVEIAEPQQALGIVKEKNPLGIILSGGPSSVYEEGAPIIPKEILTAGIPVLAICYGLQLVAHLLDGKVVSGKKEYGPAELKIVDHSPIKKEISEIEDISTVWMSHGDEVVTLPSGFEIYGSTKDVRHAFVGNRKDSIYGVQFHPEVAHTKYGENILEWFALICKEKITKREIKVDDIVSSIKSKVGDGYVIGALSGGVDSTVASVLVARAIGEKFFPIYVDNGLMRINTTEHIKKIFSHLGCTPIIVECEDEMLEKLKGITDPEEKRKIIGHFYIEIFDREVEKLSKKGIKIDYLMQGTIYSDVIESQGTRHASKIKSHHNVGGLPEDMKLKLLEPVRDLYKDEVRKVGVEVGLPEEFVWQQPFPGPGYGIRIRGEVTRERIAMQKKADTVVMEELKKAGWWQKVFQSFPVLTGAFSTAVKGDGRHFGEVIALRVIESRDVMTSTWAQLPYDLLQIISSRIVNEVPDVSRVVYDITTKPPATMEWE